MRRRKRWSGGRKGEVEKNNKKMVVGVGKRGGRKQKIKLKVK